MSTNNQIPETMFRALNHQYNSELLTAKSSLLVYFNNSVGNNHEIFSHSNQKNDTIFIKQDTTTNQPIFESERRAFSVVLHFLLVP